MAQRGRLPRAGCAERAGTATLSGVAAMKWVLGVPCLTLLHAAVSVAAPISTASAEVDGTATQAITWTDRSGAARTVHVLTDNHRIVRYEYRLDGDQVVDDAVGNYGIGNFVNHGGCDAGAVVTWQGVRDYSAEAVLTGPHHFIWRSTFRFSMCTNPDVAWRVTNEYLFVTGEDGFIQTASYDSSDLDDAEEVGDDMRGPYNQTTWPGAGPISGFGWGSEYKFVTLGPIGDGDANVAGSVAVAWDWSEPNSIPYVWEWADPAQGGAVDREYGIVQNQPYYEQDFGGGFFGCAECFPVPPPTQGEALPAAWAMPSQMNSYDSNYRSGRITWGQTYGTFENGHPNDTGTIASMGDHFRPVNAWSWTHVVGKFSAGGVAARVRDTENAYATSLTADVGRVNTEGPRGPGDFVGPRVGTMPRVTWSNPGFDFVYRTWNVTAEGGAAVVTFDVHDSLRHPVMVLHDFPGGEPAVELDGTALEHESDYYASYDSDGRRLWLTLARTLESGEHTLEIGVAASGVGGNGGAGGSDGTGGAAAQAGGAGGMSETRGAAGEGGSSGGSSVETGGPDTSAATPTASTTTSTSAGGSAGGGDGGSSDSGCGCRQGPTSPGYSVLLGALAVLTLARRRRAPSASPPVSRAA